MMVSETTVTFSRINALLVYKYGNNSIRKGKTDKLDAK